MHKVGKISNFLGLIGGKHVDDLGNAVDNRLSA